MKKLAAIATFLSSVAQAAVHDPTKHEQSGDPAIGILITVAVLVYLGIKDS
jgi:hypothetical protein